MPKEEIFLLHLFDREKNYYRFSRQWSESNQRVNEARELPDDLLEEHAGKGVLRERTPGFSAVIGLW